MISCNGTWRKLHELMDSATFVQVFSQIAIVTYLIHR